MCRYPSRAPTLSGPRRPPMRSRSSQSDAHFGTGWELGFQLNATRQTLLHTDSAPHRWKGTQLPVKVWVVHVKTAPEELTWGVVKHCLQSILALLFCEKINSTDMC